MIDNSELFSAIHVLVLALAPSQRDRILTKESQCDAILALAALSWCAGWEEFPQFQQFLESIGLKVMAFYQSQTLDTTSVETGYVQ